MKVKYYMRGLGIGIILTTLVFIISNNNNRMTDQEIMKRATELGMVSKEESNEKLDDIMKPTEAPTTAPTVAPTISPTEAPAEPTAEPTTQPTKAPSPEPTAAPTEAPVQEPDENSDSEENAGTTDTKDEIGFTIIQGMTSSQVANLLVEVGLIDDAENFNDYIVEAGKASIINVGDFNIPEGSSYKEIVEAITSK